MHATRFASLGFGLVGVAQLMYFLLLSGSDLAIDNSLNPILGLLLLAAALALSGAPSSTNSRKAAAFLMWTIGAARVLDAALSLRAEFHVWMVGLFFIVVGALVQAWGGLPLYRAVPAQAPKSISRIRAGAMLGALGSLWYFVVFASDGALLGLAGNIVAVSGWALVAVALRPWDRPAGRRTTKVRKTTPSTSRVVPAQGLDTFDEVAISSSVTPRVRGR